MRLRRSLQFHVCKLSLTYLRRNTITSYGVAFNVLNKFVSLIYLRHNTIY